MTQNYKQSEACCRNPPVSSVNYEPKGEYITHDGTQIYITGSRSSTYGLLIVYDIFGYYPQTLQGADILTPSKSSHSNSGSNPSTYLAFMPDFFDGSPAEYSWYPPTTPEKEEKLNAFFAGPAEIQKSLARLWKVQKGMQAIFPHIEKWAIIGYCWGGCVASYASGPETPFSTCVQLHPGFAPPDVAAKISIPTLVLLSKDEVDEEDRAPFEEALGKSIDHPVEVKDRTRIVTFGDMEHGWMSARANLEDKKVREGYGRGYEIVIEWLQKHIA